MEEFLGTSLPVFIGLTLFLFGGCAFLMGQSMASDWKSLRSVAGFSLLLGVGDRFLTYALFGGTLLSAGGFLVHTAVLFLIAVTSYRLTKAGRMVTQYPWLYERTGLFTWRERA